MGTAKKCLIIGVDSQIGSYLNQYLKRTGYQLFGTTRRTSNLKKSIKLIYLDLSKDFFHNSNEYFDVAIVCAGITDVDFCEKHVSMSELINVENTIKTIEYLLYKKTQVIFLSSNSVFDGSRSFYKHTDQTQPVNEYGRLKAVVENYFQDFNFFVLRLTKVLTEDPVFIKKWRNSLRKDEKIIAFNNHFISPITLEQVGEAIYHLISLHLKKRLNLGKIFQLGSNLELSYFDFANNYFKQDTKALSLIHGVKDPNVDNNKYNSLQTHLPKLI
jgi:dTDP-4-dehydrorhamnose reductase